MNFIKTIKSIYQTLNKYENRYIGNKGPIILLVLIILLAIVFPTSKIRTYKNSETNEIMSTVSSNDAELNKAIAESKKTINVFIDRMNHPTSAQRDFEVKYPFETDNKSIVKFEHMWIDSLKQISGNTYSGRLINKPEMVSNVKWFDTVTFDITKISDWKYMDNGYMVGGRTILYLLQHVSKKEREQMLKNIDYKIREYE